MWEQRTSEIRRQNLMTSREALYNELEQEDWKAGVEGEEVRCFPPLRKKHIYTYVYSLLLIYMVNICCNVCKAICKHLKGILTPLLFEWMTLGGHL